MSPRRTKSPELRRRAAQHGGYHLPFTGTSVASPDPDFDEIDEIEVETLRASLDGATGARRPASE